LPCSRAAERVFNVAQTEEKVNTARQGRNQILDFRFWIEDKEAISKS
jgi:hypothetical protein